MSSLAIIGAVAGVASAGIGAAAAAGAFDSGGPDAPNYGNVTRDTLKAQIELAPAQFAAEASPDYGQTAYTGLNLKNMNLLLNGTPGGSQTLYELKTATRNGYYTRQGKYLGEASTAPGSFYLKRGESAKFERTISAPAQEGILAQTTRANSAMRLADINDIRNYGGMATQATLDANPYNATLLSKLNAQAVQGLDAGSGLTADEQRAMQQQSRAAFAARGMGAGNGAVADELMKQFDLGQTLLRQRQQFAQSLVTTNQAVMGDPWQQVANKQSGAVPLAQATLNTGGPQLFNPKDGFGLATSNYGVAMQQNAAQNAQRAQAIKGITAGIGSMPIAQGLNWS